MIWTSYAQQLDLDPNWLGRWGSNSRPRDYEVGAIGRVGPTWSDSSGLHFIHCSVVLDSSGGVGLVCGMRRGISWLVIPDSVHFLGDRRTTHRPWNSPSTRISPGRQLPRLRHH